MCGICGIIDVSGNRISEPSLWRMTRRIGHRGPDHSDVRLFGAAGLGHARLSIIDLSPTGHQPMANEDGSLWITYNGELYNYLELRSELAAHHTFRSHSDTEVILHAYEEWGAGCVARLRGIFAFAIVDASGRKLFAARDPIGVKPFYYHFTGRRFTFASEVKAILAEVPAVAAKENIAEYLAYGWLAGSSTLFDGIKSLEPGHCLTLEARETASLTIDRYYAAGRQVSEEKYRKWEEASFPEAVDQCARIIERSVAEQMMSDVPVGTLCSGGLDSSLVTALAVKHNRNTAIFHVALLNNESLNEERYARAVAEHLGVDIHCYHLDRESFRSALVSVAYHSDFPIYNLNAVPVFCISRVARESGVKVLLAGEGGDELFGGYGWRYERLYRNIRNRRRFGQWIARLLHRNLDVSYLYPESLFLQRFRTTTPDLANATQFISGFFGRSARYEESLAAYGFVADPAERHAQAAMLTDVREYLEHLLNREDKHTMQASVECRVPLLDPRIVEFALNLPYRFKIRGQQGKWLLKKVAERYLPREIIYRSKNGFNLPARQYLDWDPRFFRDGFWQNCFGIAPETLVRHCERGDGSFWYGFLMVEIWARLFLDGDSPESVSARLAAA